MKKQSATYRRQPIVLFRTLPKEILNMINEKYKLELIRELLTFTGFLSRQILLTKNLYI